MAELLGVDWFILLGPLVLLPIVALFAFVGCALSHPARRAPAEEIALRADPATFDVTAMEIVGFSVRPTSGSAVREDVLVTQQALTLSPSPPAAGMFRGSYERILRTGPEPAIVIYSLTPSALPTGTGSFTVYPRIRDGLTDRRSMPGALFTFTVQPPGGLSAHRLRVVRNPMGAPIVEPVPPGTPFGRPSGVVTIELTFDRAMFDVVDATFTIAVSGASTIASHDVRVTRTSIAVTAAGVPTSLRTGRRYDGIHSRSLPGTVESLRFIVGGTVSGDYLVSCRAVINTATGPVTVRSSRAAPFSVLTDTPVAGAGFDVIVMAGVPTIRTR